MIKFRRMYPLGTIKRGYVSPLHPLPTIILLVLTMATLLGMYFGYAINLISGFVFYLIASVWFMVRRNKYVDKKSFLTFGNEKWIRPKGY